VKTINQFGRFHFYCLRKYSEQIEFVSMTENNKNKNTKRGNAAIRKGNNEHGIQQEQQLSQNDHTSAGSVALRGKYLSVVKQLGFNLHIRFQLLHNFIRTRMHIKLRVTRARER